MLGYYAAYRAQRGLKLAPIAFVLPEAKVDATAFCLVQTGLPISLGSP